MIKKIIDMKDIRKVYNQGPLELEVLKGISMEVNEGEFVSIIGQSGSGKSTLMNIMGCLDVYSSGSYLLDGKEINAYSERELSIVRNKKIGFIFQKFNLLSKLTALENVELPLMYRGIGKEERHERAMEALRMVGLEDRVKHSPTELSGGQQQRVAIARAIAGKPPLLLADEPTGNLDSGSTVEIMEILNNLNKMGMTLVVITHDNEIAQTANRVINIRDGLIINE